MRIGIAGLGTVGIGVVKVLQNNAALIESRIGRGIEIAAVSARDKTRKRGADVSAYKWVDKTEDLLNEKIDVLVEVIGGSEGAARALVTQALKKKIHVVTANKALLAEHGYELAALADSNGVSLRFEGSVAAGTPIIKALIESYAGNNISEIYGILNGTCNFILTQMGEAGKDFADVLKEAQMRGFAEADPSFDVDGIDTGHKLSILAALAFGMQPDFKSVEITGIRQMSALDIEFARELGYKIKMLGIAKNLSGKIMQSAEACLVPANSALGMSDNARNAVTVKGDYVGTQTLTGLGAGDGPTASGVVSDLIDLARGNHVPVFGVPAKALKKPNPIDRGQIESRYYLRLIVKDVPGVIADVGAILRDHQVSIESFVQRGRDPEQPVAVVLITHDAKHADMVKACKKIAALKCAVDEPCLIRIEEL